MCFVWEPAAQHHCLFYSAGSLCTFLHHHHGNALIARLQISVGSAEPNRHHLCGVWRLLHSSRNIHWFCCHEPDLVPTATSSGHPTSPWRPLTSDHRPSHILAAEWNNTHKSSRAARSKTNSSEGSDKHNINTVCVILCSSVLSSEKCVSSDL